MRFFVQIRFVKFTDVRDECLINVRSQMEFKEKELIDQMEAIKEELKTKKSVMTPEDIRSKKFLLNVVTLSLIHI